MAIPELFLLPLLANLPNFQIKEGNSMPLYEYQCVNCGIRDDRIAGVDDHTALCVTCGSLMLRLDPDPFAAYFESSTDCPWFGQKQPGTSKICPRHAAELMAEVREMKG